MFSHISSAYRHTYIKTASAARDLSLSRVWKIVLEHGAHLYHDKETHRPVDRLGPLHTAWNTEHTEYALLGK